MQGEMLPEVTDVGYVPMDAQVTDQKEEGGDANGTSWKL
jgi:hypothetical protein